MLLASQFTEINEHLWARGASVGIPLDGAALACALRAEGKTLVILPTRQDALCVFSDAKTLGVVQPYLLEEPPLDEDRLKGDEVFLRRGQTLSQWCAANSGLLVATPGALTAPLRFGKTGIFIERGKRLGRDVLTAWLAENGYRRAELVWQPGEYTVRGGIVDFFDPSEEAPVRVEFFDEDVESIRRFQPRTQRSFEQISSFTPRSVSQGSSPDEGVMWGNFRSVLVQPKKLEDSYWAFAELYNAVAPERKRVSPNAYEEFLLNTGHLLRLRAVLPGDPMVQTELNYGRVPYFKGNLQAAQAYIASQIQNGCCVHITSRTLTGSLFDPSVCMHRGESLSGGTAVNDLKEIWISDAELFGINEVSAGTIDFGMPLDLEASLRPGQWVIHEKYGLCQLAGTSVEEFSGQKFETIVLQFEGEQKLIIPTSELFRLTPWNGEGEPEADSLSSKRWRSAWKKAEAEIEAEAQGLLTLYAQRELARGRAFPRDGSLMEKFEASFPYTETADQLRAIREVKQDMMRPWPMDRLIVGDVGYGKTEVVLRAAVKAVESGTQAVLIAPTTVLALQHYRTCCARMGELPIRVELLTRMIPKQRQKQILADTAEGRVDILIGTHRLFQDDIAFKDLGLLIIDEEQRFGVQHKERLKVTHPGLDVLSLSATPIPRSLSMALRGIRDISVISTPPKSRGEVFTVTSVWDWGLVCDAISRELARGGQVYYLHNRVEDIEEVQARLANRYPGHSVAVAHGQMGERLLEDTMNRFYDGKIEILVCTTIIESGLDVPRANTLVVDDVRRLGLAQMHQIRGRIGRRSENAYALFFYDEHQGGQTRERLEAFGAVSAQNSGYRLAQRDLEIRGAGEILGTSQHGFKERIGYTLYLKKLKERVDDLRGAGVKTVLTDISIPLTIPMDYVPQMDLRIGLYRRLLLSLSFSEYDAMTEELADRYGPLPEQVRGLLDAALIRGEGHRAGIEKMSVASMYIALDGALRGDLFQPPKWVLKNGSYLSAGGLKGLAAAADELKKLRGEEQKQE
ncbi:MAG: helicase-related protein [Pyramidobacter sp.]|nr:helicase-related protein [Pyramidobacter sp.]